MMDIGVAIPHFAGLAEREPIERLARAVEALGYDSIWVSDHIVVPEGTQFLPDAQTEILATLAFLAGITSRVRLGTSVLVVPYRPSVFTAKFLASVDVLAEGRLVVGVGVGRLRGEFDALGVPFEDRVARTDEDLAVWRNLWATETSSFHGRWTTYDNVRMFPKGHAGRPGPPIYFGGVSDLAISRAARLADGWHPIVVGDGDLSAPMTAYRRACEQSGAGRGFVSLRHMAGYPTVDVAKWPFAGDADERVAALLTVAGDADEFVIDASMLCLSGISVDAIVDLLAAFARDVRPLL
jgi:probable F420-dependent oxidoreductase